MEKPRLSGDVVVKKKGDVTVYMNPNLPSWMVLEKEGARALELFDGTRGVHDVAQALADEFGDQVEEVERGLDGLLSTAEKNALFSKVEPKRNPGTFYPLSFVWLYVTRRCNLRCDYCYLSAGEPLEEELSLEEIKDLLDEFKESNPKGSSNLVLSGGEPLMRKDFWDIVAHARELGMYMTLATNGILIDEGIARRIKENMHSVQISLDGPRDIHDLHRGKGSFDAAIRGIVNLKAVGMDPAISATITRQGMERLNELWDICAEHGLRQVKANPVVPLGRAEEEGDMALTPEMFHQLWRETRRALKERDLSIQLENDRSIFKEGLWTATGWACGAGITSLSIDSDGSVYPCQAAHAREFYCGNVREKGLDAIRNDSTVLREWMNRHISEIPECRGCEWKMWCGGGCTIQAVRRGGRVNSPDYYCEVYKKQFEESLWNYVDKVMDEKER